MLTHTLLDELETFCANSKEAKNERLMERVVEYLNDEIKSIKLARRAGRKEAAFVVERAAASHMRLLRERADHFTDQEFREQLPDWVSGLAKEYQLLWVRTYRAEYKKSGSHAMGLTVAEENVRQSLNEERQSQ